MPNEVPIDPSLIDSTLEDDQEDALLPEGKAVFSWEKYDTSNPNEGWGHANPSHRRRHRLYEGDDLG